MLIMVVANLGPVWMSNIPRFSPIGLACLDSGPGYNVATTKNKHN